MENLEPTLLASRKISEFLRNFSETQWTRLVKAVLILGIQDLENNHFKGNHGNITQLYPKDIEDIVVKNEEIQIQKKRDEKMSKKKVAQPKQANGKSSLKNADSQAIQRSSSVPSQLKQQRFAQKKVPEQKEKIAPSRTNKLRQSHSESFILERKQQQKTLDPRIYPSWWGEPLGESPKKPASKSKKQPETSLERGMREIKETASRLDKNMQKFKTKEEEPAPMGFGSSFRPNATQQNVRQVQQFGNFNDPELQSIQKQSPNENFNSNNYVPVRKAPAAINIPAPKPQKRPVTAKTQATTQGPKQRMNNHMYKQKEHQAHHTKTLPSYLRNVQSKERNLIARDKMKATNNIQSRQNEIYNQLTYQRQAPPITHQTSKKIEEVEIYVPANRPPSHKESSRGQQQPPQSHRQVSNQRAERPEQKQHEQRIYENQYRQEPQRQAQTYRQQAPPAGQYRQADEMPQQHYGASLRKPRVPQSQDYGYQTGRTPHQANELFGAAGSPIMMASGEYDADQDPAEHERMISEEQYRIQQDRYYQQQQMMAAQQQQHDPQYERRETENDPIGEDTEEYMHKMQKYVDNAMKIGLKLGLEKNRRMEEEEVDSGRHPTSNPGAKETLTLSGSLSQVNRYQPAQTNGQNSHYYYQNPLESQARGGLRQTSNRQFQKPDEEESNDDGQLSNTSNEDNEQMLKQDNRERILQPQNLNTSSELTNTQDNGDYVAGEDGQTSSDISSPTRSPQAIDNGDRYPDEKSSNPLFRSDAFDQIPSHQHQVNSQGGMRHNMTNNTDQNLQENFRSETTDYRNGKGYRNQAYGQRPIVSHQHSSSIPTTLQMQGSNYGNRDLINNTNDLNPMIMMSGEEGSASPSGVHSIMNQTNLTQNHGVGQHPPPQFSVISPQNQVNMTNDGSVGGPNPFATQAMIGLHQLPSSGRQRNQSQSRQYDPRQGTFRGGQRGHQESPQYPDNYEPWTGRNQYVENEENKQQYYQQEPESPLLGDADGDISYFNGQQNAYYANETQDRPSIISKSNLHDLTGISRGNDVPATPEPQGSYIPQLPSAARTTHHFGGGGHSRGISPNLGLSGDLASSSDISYYNPDFMNRYTKDSSKERDLSPGKQYLPQFQQR